MLAKVLSKTKTIERESKRRTKRRRYFFRRSTNLTVKQERCAHAIRREIARDLSHETGYRWHAEDVSYASVFRVLIDAEMVRRASR